MVEQRLTLVRHGLNMPICGALHDLFTVSSPSRETESEVANLRNQKMLAVVASVTNSWAAAARPALHVAPRALAIRMQFISTIPKGLPDHLQDMAEEVCSGEATLFDVREPGEHAQGMLAIAQGLPLSMLQDGFFAGTDALDKFKSKTAYLHCAAGIRVHPAAECLQQLGFERVVPLQEGVRRSDSNPTPAPLAEFLRFGCHEENSKPLMMGRSIPVPGSSHRSTSWASRSRRIEITHTILSVAASDSRDAR